MMKRVVESDGGVDVAQLWRARFGEYEAGDVSIDDLCARHGVSVATWHYWRKKLGVVISRRRRGSGRRRASSVSTSADALAAGGVSGFSELVVTGESSAAPAAGIEIVLCSGVVVRVGAGAGERELAMVLRGLSAC